MKRSLRRAHRVIFLVLLIVLPALYVAALWARRTPAVMTTMPADLQSVAPATP